MAEHAVECRSIYLKQLPSQGPMEVETHGADDVSHVIIEAAARWDHKQQHIQLFFFDSETERERYIENIVTLLGFEALITHANMPTHMKRCKGHRCPLSDSDIAALDERREAWILQSNSLPLMPQATSCTQPDPQRDQYEDIIDLAYYQGILD